MIDTNSPDFLRRVDQLSKIVNAAIGRIEDDPAIILPTLYRQLAITIVTEVPGERKKVISYSMRALREQLKDAYAKLDIALDNAKRQDEEAPPE